MPGIGTAGIVKRLLLFPPAGKKTFSKPLLSGKFFNLAQFIRLCSEPAKTEIGP
jgi:hypothetical protein